MTRLLPKSARQAALVDVLVEQRTSGQQSTPGSTAAAVVGRSSSRDGWSHRSAGARFVHAESCLEWTPLGLDRPTIAAGSCGSCPASDGDGRSGRRLVGGAWIELVAWLDGVASVPAMHELSICSAVAEIVGEHAGGRRVEYVLLDIGQLRQVIPETLRYSWEIVVADTDLAGSQLVINHIPATITCRACGATTAITVPMFRCECGSTDVEVTSGQELLVRSLELVGD
jgi:hydrogenase nickel incorporation protein HypA/HybF